MFYDTITNISINIYWCGSLRFSDFGSMTIIHLFCFKKYIVNYFYMEKNIKVKEICLTNPLFKFDWFKAQTDS